MAASTSFINESTLTPQQLHELNEVAYEHRLLARPDAIALNALGLESKAQAREHCGNFGVLEACKSDHVHMVIITCRQKYCLECGPKRSAANLERWFASHPYLRERKHFLYVDLWRDYATLPTPEERDQFAQDVGSGADVARAGRVAGTGAVFNIVAHMLIDLSGQSTGYRLRAKLIWWGDFDLETAHKSWPKTLNMIKHMPPAANFNRVLERVMDQEIPTDPQLQAQFELLFNKFRNLRSIGGFVRAKDDGPDTDASTDISEELFPMEGDKEITPKQKLPRRCKKCGAPIVRRSERCRVNISNDERAVLTWYEIPQEE